MKDFTQGSIPAHLMSVAMPTAVGMLFQALNYFVDLYFVTKLGGGAVAGVSVAGNLMFIIVALTQVLGVGTVALISHAVGRNDQQDANLIFNQSLLIAAILGTLALIGGYAMCAPYLRSVASDEATAVHGGDFLRWALPGMALQFALVSMGSALRGTGIVKPGALVQVATVLLNIVLAPILITGWGPARPMGVAGAGLASTLSVLGGVVLLCGYFNRIEQYVAFHPEHWQPRFTVWKRMFTVGLPVGGEFLLLFAYTSIAFWAIGAFGPTAQAALGICSRIMTGMSLPAMAIALAVTPVAGQNYSAQQMGRVLETFRAASIQSMSVMLAVILLCQWQAEAMVRFFSPEPELVRVGALFLRFVSWNYALGPLILACSGVFQALGNALPVLWCSTISLVVYAIPLMWLHSQPGYKIEHVWYLSIAATILQAALNAAFVWRQLRLQSSSTLRHLWSDSENTRSGINLSGQTLEHIDGRHQTLDSPMQERAGPRDHSGEDDSCRDDRRSPPATLGD